jgi:hypothetical protein
MTPSPFQIGQAIGSNIGQVQERHTDLTAIDQILSQAGQSGDQQAIDTAMNQILARVSPNRQKTALDILQKRRDAIVAQSKPQAAVGGITGQPVPVEVSETISEVMKMNPEAGSDELALSLDKAGVPRAFSNSFIENRRRKEEREEQIGQKKFESERTYQSKRAIPFLTKLDAERVSLDDKDQALSLMTNAIDEQDVSFFSKDNFAGFLGRFGEGLRTAKGAQLITAQKEFLLGNIARAGARPNMYIEQQISNMLPKIGRSREANQTVVASFTAEQELARKKQEIADDLIEKYENELGYVPGNIASQVDKAVKPFAVEIQNKLSYNLRNIQENEMGEKVLKRSLNKKVPKGTPLTLQTAKLFMEKEGSKDLAMKRAQELGYTIPTVEQYRGYLQ